MSKQREYLKVVTQAFGPDDGVNFDQQTWTKIHAAIREALAEQEVGVSVERLTEWKDRVNTLSTLSLKSERLERFAAHNIKD